MAYITSGAFAGVLSGMLGKEIAFRQWEGMTVVAKAPGKRKGTAPSAQALTQQRFQLASRYAKAVIRNEIRDMADAYTLVLKKRQNVYSRALQDFMSVPVVESIKVHTIPDGTGSRIIVRAKDDFRVAAVRVEICTADGSRLESGVAKQNINGMDWTYTIKQADHLQAGNMIRAVATDVPGNEGEREVVM